MKHAKPLIGLAAVSLAVGIAMPTFAASGNKYPSQTQTQHCSGNGGDNTVALTGPETLWPPNHKMVSESATSHDASGGQTTLTVTPSADDISGGDGGPTHDPDYMPGPGGFTNSGSPDATVPFSLRAERSGKGDGRTYTINWDAQFSDGTHCSSSDGSHTPFTITVPHDQSGGAGWK